MPEHKAAKLPPLDRRNSQNKVSGSQNIGQGGVEERTRHHALPPQLPPMSTGTPRTPPNKRSSPILGFDSGQPRDVRTAAGKSPIRASSPKRLQVPLHHEPPNFRIGMLEADYEGEIINSLDVVDYYASYGHTANIQLFHLVADDPSGHPYDLRVVPRATVPPEYFTMSAAGVTHIKTVDETGHTIDPPHSDFLPLSTWLRELSAYNMMRQLPLFRTYLPRKMLRIWRNATHARVFGRVRTAMQERLFYAKPAFVTLLMDATRLLHAALSCPLMPFTGPKMEWRRKGDGKWEYIQSTGAGDLKASIADYVKQQEVHTQSVVRQRHSVAVRQVCALFARVSDDVTSHSRYLGDIVAGFKADPSAGATKGLSAPRVQLERLERAKQHRSAAQMQAHLPRLARLLDYLCVCMAVSALDEGLADLRALLSATGVLTCRVSFHENSKGLLVEPAEAAVALAVTKQVSESFFLPIKTLERLPMPAVPGRPTSPRSAAVAAKTSPGAVAASTPPATIPPPPGAPTATATAAAVAPVAATSAHVSFTSVIVATRTIGQSRAACDVAVSSSFRTLFSCSSELDPLWPIFAFAHSWSPQQYKDGSRSVVQFRADMMLLREWMNVVDGMCTGKRVGLLWMDTSGLQELLRSTLQRALGVLCMVLEVASHERLIGSLASLQDLVRSLSSQPVSLAEFSAFLRTLTQVQEGGGGVMAEVEIIQEMYAMLSEYGGKMRPDDEVLFSDMQEGVKAYGAALIEAREFAGAQREGHVEGLASAAAALVDSARNVSVDCAAGRYDDATAEPAAMQAQLLRLEQQFMDVARKRDELLECAKLLEVPSPDFTTLDAAGKDLAMHKNKWDLLTTFQSNQESWMTCPVSDLQPNDIQAAVDEANRQNYKMLKTRSNDSVVQALKSELDDFKEQLPLLQELANPALKDRHWETIFSIVEQEFEAGTPVHVRQLLEYGVLAKLEDIQTVAATASKEHSMLKMLEKMETEWEGVELKTTPYKDSGTCIVGGIDDVQAILDDQIVKIQAISASPFVAPFRERASGHEATLQTLQDLLDAWLACQATWLYLEPIFSSADIVKQMPEEGEKFASVDAIWREVMARAVEAPAALPLGRDDAALNSLRGCNGLLDEIQKGLAAYLEKKRLFFPRFFFLSNDEMLEILSETKDPTRVQPHLKKCFEGVDSLTFTDALAITHLTSVEGESVPLAAPVDTARARGAVERWLLEAEAAMFAAVHAATTAGVADYAVRPRDEWVLRWPGMVVLAVASVFWTEGATAALCAAGGGDGGAVKGFEEACTRDLLKIVDLVRGELTKLQRATLGALVVMDVHTRDVVAALAAGNVSSQSEFDWQAQLRSYWVEDPAGEKGNTIMMHMMSAELEFGYEYLGNSSRLVITPLTDRCYRTLTGAIHLTLGGAPEGPAGTGKTETTKDLAKALARQCVVFNCSDSLDYIAMGKFFKGLAASGAWACFDEFNRIDLEVLSVVAQQVLDIQRAVGAKLRRFTFEGTEMQLKWSAWCSITMNPGYAGRSELPDNLKALFRTVAMMVPDYAMISEIILFSFGYLQARECAKKIVQCYKLCSEQLSSQDHYDYGMRAVMAVLRAAGNLKRRFPAEDEFVLMLRSIIDVNLCKFLADDVPLFRGIVGDLFLGVTLPKADYAVMEGAMTAAAAQLNLQPTQYCFMKAIQLYEMVLVRHGLMIVGHPFAAKTSSYRLLANALTRMAEAGEEGANRVECHVINPKSITMGQLYGQFDPISHEWTDGILAVTFRACASNPSPDQKWLILDGPVDAIWIENMNTVLDDNKKLCLNSGEIIQMSPQMNMIFEVMDLAVASPATVSRCGMVYMDAGQVGWRPLTLSWLNTLPPALQGAPAKHLLALFDWLVPVSLRWVRRETAEASPTLDGNLVTSLQRVVTAVTVPLAEAVEGGLAPLEAVRRCEGVFLFALVWSIGASAATVKGRTQFDAFMRAAAAGELPGYVGPSGEKYNTEDDIPPGHVTLKGAMLPSDKGATVYSSFFDVKDGKFKPWEAIMDTTAIPKDAEIGSIIVQTTDTVRYTYLLDLAVTNGYPCLFVGPTGTGKSVYMLKYINGVPQTAFAPSIVIGFSARTTANMTQHMVDAKLDRRRKGVFGPAAGKRVIVMVDDMNMPQPETYGAQPPIEILRQYMDHEGWYDRANTFRRMVDCQFVAAMGLPGGGRTFITPRFARHFHHVGICEFDSASMNRIFSTILGHFFSKAEFPDNVVAMKTDIILATIDVYNTSSESLLPTPTKSHYLFNLRDVARVIYGLTMLPPSTLPAGRAGVTKYVRLWVHETLRVFYDRLADDADRQWLLTYVKDVTRDRLGTDFDEAFRHLLPTAHAQAGLEELRSIFFTDFMDEAAEEPDQRTYDEAQDAGAVVARVEDLLADHNANTRRPMNLAVFLYAAEHIARAARILRQPGAHLLAVGVGGSGRASVSRLAASICGMTALQIEVSKSYGSVEWKDDLKKFTRTAGAEGKPCMFLFSDSQIKLEGFVEDINALLNSGEVPNLFPYDERASVCEAVRPAAVKAGRPAESPADLWNFFVDRTKANLHIVLCFSPIGDAFRERLRQFPSLVNCCTIDWYTAWPADALSAVATKFLTPVAQAAVGSAATTADAAAPDPATVSEMAQGLAGCCRLIHRDSAELSARFRREAGRVNYVTPTSYLELLTMFASLLDRRRGAVAKQQKRYAVGLEKLEFTEQQVAVMQTELKALQPSLIQTVAETDALMEQVSREKAEVVEPKKAVVDAEVAKAEEAAAAANSIKVECEAALAVAMPVLESALKALDTIKPADIKLVQSFKNPPGAIKVVMEAVCVLLDLKPAKVPDPSGSGKKIDDYWEPSKKALGDPNFVTSLKTYDKDNISPKTIETIRRVYTSNPDFTPAVAAKASSAAEGLCKWVCAMERYEEVAKVVAPKQAALAEAQGAYDTVMAALTIKQAELKEVMDNLAKLEQTLSESMEKKQRLEGEVELCSQKLERAQTLIGGLGGEKLRWTDSAAKLQEEHKTLTGDTLLAAAAIAYLGAFTAPFRDSALSAWADALRESGFLVSSDFSLTNALGDPVKIREWTIHGLPNDAFSIDNGIMVDTARRWPLMIDPQSQANKWVKAMEASAELRVIKLTDGDFMRTLESAVQFGLPVLLENVGEELDPSLEPLLLKEVFKQGGVEYIRLGDSQVEFSSQFRFYITTALRNPHYLPETAVKVTLLNFMITQEGLSDQLLSVAVAEERPDLEAQRQRLVVESAANKAKLAAIETRILQVLSESQGNILEDATAVGILSEAKAVANDVEEKQAVADETRREIDEARTAYARAGAANAVLFFAVRDLATVDPMYQYSLAWFIKLFVRSISEAEPQEDIPARLRNINDHFAFMLYVNICRSLFEKDKLLFAVLLAMRILASQALLSEDRISFLLTGGVGIAEVKADNPAPNWISAKAWGEICRAAMMTQTFAKLPADICANVPAWQAIFDAVEPQCVELPGAYSQLSAFDKLLIVRMIRPDKLVPAMSRFVTDTLGVRFTEPPPFDLPGSFRESSAAAPLLFVLSPGSDPTAALLKYADETGAGSRISIISMGQGQGPKAAKLIAEARRTGAWVLLQNCHLAASWMPALEKICEGTSADNTDADYRLWMTSMPSPAFPVTVLQNAVKMTNEPPAGLRANLARTYTLEPIADDEAFFETATHPQAFKRMMFGLAFVHAFVQERRKFGPIGWNIPYGFDDGDLRISARQLHLYTSNAPLATAPIGDDGGSGVPAVPFAAIKYAIGECNYGGRVTDDKDRRLLTTILDCVYRPEIVAAGAYPLSASGTYAVPAEVGDRQHYLAEIDRLPPMPQPEAFGLHENADITKDLAQTDAVTAALLLCGGSGGGGPGGGAEARVAAMVTDIAARLPPQFDIEKAQARYPVKYEESMNQVLCQEMLRYNRLTAIIRASLLNLDKAVKGLQVMNAELDGVFQAMAIGAVPAAWKGKSFPSLKPLASYVDDLLRRLDMFASWYKRGAPASFWLPGFFFTPSFTTAALQNFVRARNMPIDAVQFEFAMMPTSAAAAADPPAEGVYVYGMYLEGCAWDGQALELTESQPKVLTAEAPVVWLKPVTVGTISDYPHYSCPVYRTAERKGVLATTGHSTNFLMFMKMPSSRPEHHWIMRGVCMLLSLSD